MTAYILECLPYDPVSGGTRLLGFASGLVDESYLGRTIPYPLRLKNTFSMETSVYENNVPSSTSFSLGSLDLNNADGRFDDLLNLGWGGAQVILLAGPENGSYFDFRPVFAGAALDISANAKDITLVLRDLSWSFSERLQKNIYSGGGGADGFSDLNGQYKPLCYGLAKNISPVGVDTINLTYQVHDGAIVGITGVYDDAVPLANFGNFPDYASLIAAKIPDGAYATCYALGFFRLGAPAVGAITVDVRGEFYSSTSLAGVVYQIMTSKVGLPVASMDLSTFSEHAVEFPYPPSGIYYQNPDVQIDEFLDALVGMCDSFWNITTASKLAMRRFKFRTPVAGIREENIKDLQRQTNSKPVYSVTVQYDRNLTVQEASSMPIADGTLLVALNQDTVWYPNGPITAELRAFVGNTLVNELKIVTFTKLSNVGWATIDNVGKITLTDAPDGGRVAFRTEYQDQRADVELLVRRRADGTGSYISADPDIFQFKKDGTVAVPGSYVEVYGDNNAGDGGASTWVVRDSFGTNLGYNVLNARRIRIQSEDVTNSTASFVIVSQTFPSGIGNSVHIPVARSDATVAAGGGKGGTYDDGTPIDDLRPQEAGSNVTEMRISEAVKGQGEWATLATLPVSTVSTKISRVEPDGTIRLGDGGILLSEKADYWITDSNAVTALGVSSGFQGQKALATQDSANWLTQVTGAGRPENYATSGVNLIYNGNAETVLPEQENALYSSPVGWACVEGTQGNVNNMFGDETKVSLNGIYGLGSVADAPVSGKRTFYINKGDVGHGVGYGARAISVKPGEKLVVSFDYFGATATASGLYFRAQWKATKPENGFVTTQQRDDITDLIGNGPITVFSTHAEFVLTVPPGMFWMTLSVYNWSNGTTDLRFDNVAAYRVIDFSTSVGGLTKPENNATVGAIAGINLLDGINGIILALNAIKTSLGTAAGFVGQGLLAIKSSVTTSLMTTQSDSIVPDGNFNDANWWRGGDTPTNIQVGPADAVSHWGLSPNWLALYPGDFDSVSPFFSVMTGGTYKIEVRVATSPDFVGWLNPCIHMPYVAWYSLTRGPINDPNDANYSDLRSGSIVLGKEFIRLNPPANGGDQSAAWRQWQFRMRGNITAGRACLQVRITRVSPLGTLVTQQDGVTSLTDALAVTSLGNAAGFAGQDWGATASQGQVADTSPIGTNVVVNSSFSNSVNGWYLTANSGGRGLLLNLPGYFGARRVAYTYAPQVSPVGQYVDISTKGGWSGTEPSRGTYMLQVREGQRIGISALVSVHRGRAGLFALFYDSNGAMFYAPEVQTGWTSGGANGGDNMGYMSNYVDVPTGGRYVEFMLRLYGTGEADPYLFFSEPMLCKMSPNQTKVPPYSNGPVDYLADQTSANVASGFAGQGSFAKLSAVDRSNFSSYFNINAFSLNYSITRQDGVSIVTENLAITTLGISAGFAGQGALAKQDTVTANQVVTGSLTNSDGSVAWDLSDASGRRRISKGGYRFMDGAAFGPGSDLIQWYGPTSVPYGSETKTNGIWAFATDGKVYYGTQVLSTGGGGGTPTQTVGLGIQITKTLDPGQSVSLDARVYLNGDGNRAGTVYARIYGGLSGQPGVIATGPGGYTANQEPGGDQVSASYTNNTAQRQAFSFYGDEVGGSGGSQRLSQSYFTVTG